MVVMVEIKDMLENSVESMYIYLYMLLKIDLLILGGFDYLLMCWNEFSLGN